MAHPVLVVLTAPLRHALPQLALLAALIGLPATARAQDPVAEFHRILLTRPPIDALLATEKQLAELKKFYDEREQTLNKIIDTQLKSFTQLRQVLLLKDWLDVAKTGREDPQIMAADVRLRSRVAQKFRDKVHVIVAKGDDDTKAAVANLLTEMGLTVRAGGAEGKADPGEAERRGGFARSLTGDVLKLAQSPSEFVKLHALRALAGINPNPRVAAPVFAKVLTSGEDVRVRRVAADGLLRLIAIASYLRDQRLRSEDVSATEYDVITAAAAVVAAAPIALTDKDTLVRTRAAQALRASAQALADLFKKSPEDTKRVAPTTTTYTPADVEAIKELLKAFQRAGPELTAALTDADPEVRLAVVGTLARLSDARYRLAEEPISFGTAGKLQDRVYLVPPQASDPLATFAKGDWRLVARLLTDPDKRVRLSAATFLEYFPEAMPSAVPELTRAVCDPDRFVRWAAARALGNFSKTYQPKDAVSAVPALAKMLFDPEFTDRLAAASTLEAMGPFAETAVPELARAVHFGDAENRVAALYVVQSIGPERSRSLIPSVTEALEQPDPRVRRTAAETLGKYGRLARNRATLDALRRAQGDEDQEVRINASEAILQILADE
jgi:HEAT repeat protein